MKPVSLFKGSGDVFWQTAWQGLSVFCLWKVNLPNQAGGNGEICRHRDTGRDSQREASGAWEIPRERENSEFFSLPYSRCFTYIIACNTIDISIFYFTSEDPESQWGHRDETDTMLRADTLHSWTSHPGLPIFEAH